MSGEGGRGVWARQCDRSPLVHVVRRLLRRPTGEDRLFERSSLDGEVLEACRDIVRRTRLRGREREDVARELVAHALDALDGGRGGAEVAASMGDHATVAKLIRRGVIRKRSGVYQAWYYTSRSVPFGIAGAVLFYGAYAVRFYVGEPTISTNYVAKLNALEAGVPEEERSWPLWRAAIVPLGVAAKELNERSLEPAFKQEEARAEMADEPKRWDATGIDTHWLWPDHPDYGVVVALMREHERSFELMREAASKTAIGMRYSTQGLLTETHDDPLRSYTPKPALDDPAAQGTLIDVLLPNLGVLRRCGYWLRKHAMVAAHDGDAETAAADIEAMIGLSRQASRHPFLIGYLVGVAIEQFTSETLLVLLDEYPDLFSERHLASFAHGFARVPGNGVATAVRHERLMVDDVLQRTFTDDGRGGGRLTRHALTILGEDPLELERAESVSLPPIAIAAAKPIGALLVRNRRDIAAQADRLYNEFAVLAGLPADELVPSYESLDAYFETWSGLGAVRRWPLGVLVPALGRSLEVQHVASYRHDAVLAVIALHAYRLRNGGFPESLSEIPPALLPGEPADLFSPGESLRYRKRDQSFVLYSVGADGDDDGGRRWEPGRSGRRTFGRGSEDIFRRFDHVDGNEADADVVIFPVERP